MHIIAFQMCCACVHIWGWEGEEEYGRIWGIKAKLQVLSLAGKIQQTDMK